MSDAPKVTPPEPPNAEVKTTQSLNGEVLDPVVTDANLRPQSVGAVVEQASLSGSRSLGGPIQTQILAVTIRKMEDQILGLTQKLDAERERRENAEMDLAKIEGAESNSLQVKIFSGLCITLGAVLLGVGLNVDFDQTSRFEFDPVIGGLGFVLLIVGYFVPHLGGGTK